MRVNIRSALSWLIVPAMFALLMLTPIYDQQVPVLKSFNVTSVKWVPGGIEVWGVMEKRRACQIKQFHAIVEYRGGRPREPRVIKTPADAGEKRRLLSRLTGRSAFGPWFIDVPSEAIAVDIYTGHDCWLYRLTERRIPIWRRGS